MQAAKREITRKNAIVEYLDYHLIETLLSLLDQREMGGLSDTRYSAK